MPDRPILRPPSPDRRPRTTVDQRALTPLAAEVAALADAAIALVAARRAKDAKAPGISIEIPGAVDEG